MKLKYALLALALSISANISHAGVGTDTGGGGDPCDNQIEIVRDDIKSWVQQDGGKDLVLPSTISYEYYVNGMLDMINRSHLSCRTEPIVVAGAEKTCVNNFDKNGLPYIICNRNLIENMSIDDLYVLTHHEYASLARVENNVGADSDYSVSNQISGFLDSVTIKKLSVKGKIDKVPTKIANIGSFTYDFTSLNEYLTTNGIITSAQSYNSNFSVSLASHGNSAYAEFIIYKNNTFQTKKIKIHKENLNNIYPETCILDTSADDKYALLHTKNRLIVVNLENYNILFSKNLEIAPTKVNTRHWGIFENQRIKFIENGVYTELDLKGNILKKLTLNMGAETNSNVKFKSYFDRRNPDLYIFQKLDNLYTINLNDQNLNKVYNLNKVLDLTNDLTIDYIINKNLILICNTSKQNSRCAAVNLQNGKRLFLNKNFFDFDYFELTKSNYFVFTHNDFYYKMNSTTGEIVKNMPIAINYDQIPSNIMLDDFRSDKIVKSYTLGGSRAHIILYALDDYVNF